MAAKRCLRVLFFGWVCGVLIGCSSNAELLNARAQEVNEVVIVEVAIHSSDAHFIKRQEVYAYIVVKECDGGGVRFPIEPWVSGQRVSGFSFKIDDDVVELSGSIPVAVFNSYKRPCATLEGGSYGLGKLSSKAVPIDIRRRKP